MYFVEVYEIFIVNFVKNTVLKSFSTALKLLFTLNSVSFPSFPQSFPHTILRRKKLGLFLFKSCFQGCIISHNETDGGGKMKYSVELSACGNTFFLPSLVGDCIKLATEEALKTIIYIYRNAGKSFTAQEISKALKLDENEVVTAIEFWDGYDLISEEVENEDSDTEEKILSEEAAQIKAALTGDKEEKLLQPVQPVQKERQVEKIHINPPTHAELAKRCLESQDLREILTSTEQRLNTTLSFSMQSTLVMLYDDYGLPVEVIEILVEYAVSRKKATARYIANLGRLWCEKEIDTYERAMEYVETQGAAERYWGEFCEATKVKNPSPTPKQRDFLHSWINTMHFSMDMIVLAYNEMAENTDKFSFPYMNKVLVNWQKNGIFTPDQAAAAKQERLEKYQNKSNKKNEEKPSKPASYDLDAYTKKAFSNPMNILNKKED